MCAAGLKFEDWFEEIVILKILKKSRYGKNNLMDLKKKVSLFE